MLNSGVDSTSASVSDRLFSCLPIHFSTSSMRITGKEKASTSFQSWSVSGATENTLANGGM